MQEPASHRFFTNGECEYYPCHGLEGQNCLFCFCPLYFAPIECGGNYRLLEGGVMDCSQCLIPHDERGYDYVLDKLKACFRQPDQCGAKSQRGGENSGENET